MRALNALKGMKTTFPKIVTNEYINNMPRMELTEEQKDKPYSKYYHKDMAKIPQVDLDMVNAGPVNAEKALPIHRANEMLNDGYLDVETGYCLMEDGTGMAATKVFMPNVTPQMIDWWFNWHPLDSLRYMIWCPVAHAGISAKTPEAHLDASGVPMHIRNIGKVHYPIEGFYLEKTSPVVIAFQKPSVLGLTQEMIDNSSMSTFEIATCTNRFPKIPINVFFHAVREVEGGIEFRSRYWLMNTVKNGVVKRSKLPIPKSIVLSMSRNNCIHSLTEYNNLASFLPQIYKERQGLILE